MKAGLEVGSRVSFGIQPGGCQNFFAAVDKPHPNQAEEAIPSGSPFGPDMENSGRFLTYPTKLLDYLLPLEPRQITALQPVLGNVDKTVIAHLHARDLFAVDAVNNERLAGP
jgi:hypothetical protein